MKISTKGRYALRLMIDLAEHDTGEWISLKDISGRQGISIKYLEQIVGSLSKAGFLRSVRGSHGGYRLAKDPKDYTVGSILQITEGDLAPVSCLKGDENICGRKEGCPTIGFWEGLHKTILDYVESYTLADLVEEEAAELNYQI